MPDRARWSIQWIDFLWLVFLGGLALLPPVDEVHKQLIILGIVVIQLFEGQIIRRLPERGRAYVVALKILFATLLLDHTGEMGINSPYYPIYFLPVVSAAIYFGDYRHARMDNCRIPRLCLAADSGASGI